MSIRKPLMERFWDKVMPEPNSGCWLWIGSLTDGYAHLRVGNRMVLGHRISYEEFVGPIPDGLQIDHLCAVKSCVNPDHLDIVTNSENMKRRRERNGKKPFFDCGHRRTSENTRHYMDNRKGPMTACRICRRVSENKYAAKRRAT